MKRIALTALTILIAISAAHAGSDFAISTDRVAYTGTVTRYATMDDLNNDVNGAIYAIPDRVTDSPFDTGSRDIGMFVVNNTPSVYSNANILVTAWSYTTTDNTNINPDTGLPYEKDHADGDRLYSGWGNPNNTNTGFLQMYDLDGSTDSQLDAAFGGFDGSYYRELSLSLHGAGATYDPDVVPNDYARLWPAPQVGGSAGISVGLFHSYELDVTFSGLEGVEIAPGVIEATNHPTGVVGTFTAVFENKNATWYPDSTWADSTHEGFYKVEYTFNMDNWAYGMGDEALNGDFDSSYFITPEPATMSLLGLGAIALIRRRRR